MIDLLSSSFGIVSLTKQIYRKTKLKQINQDVTVYLSVFKSTTLMEAVFFECLDFPAIIQANRNRDTSYFINFTTKVFEDSGIKAEISSCMVDDEFLIKYVITFDKQLFVDINLSQYEYTIRKLIKTISGV